MKSTYTEREAIAAVTNIDNALLQLEMFKEKGLAAIPLLDDLIFIADGGVEERHGFRWKFYNDLKQHLLHLYSDR